jgi:hypothetical protein
MNNYIKEIEDIKEFINEEINSCNVKEERKNILIATYYDLCFVQEKLERNSSGLVISENTEALKELAK